ncbi:Transcription initiation factor TFIID subunit 7 [Paragonimus heterotremus]|uniref:Transcription initiation factor TFIID subunit 7 n=1 Tax=Paragonimus heterotremus TaxID=100268 RepID=A0A8J4T7E7_9TREM|nr:Transcription initiation factor TFIID subunit 7 [Paragonimus heterotremus]
MSNKLPLDSNYDLEQQFILRMTDLAAAENLAADIEAGTSFKENFTLELKPDTRHAIVRYNGQVYQGRLMDLPCIIESLKTTDKSGFYKTADICQMMVCTQGEDNGPLRGTAAYLDDRTRSWNNSFDSSRESREFQFLHGITAPLKNVLRRRFRKTRRKRFVDMPKIEKEVKQLLRADLQAVGVKWEVIWSDPPSANTGTGLNDGMDVHQEGILQRDSQSLQTGGHNPSATGSRQAAADDEVEEEDEEGTRPYPVDRRDVFGDISSSSVDSSDSSGASDEEQVETALKTDVSKASVHANTAVIPSMPSDTHSGNSPNSTGLETLKHELAAELLLSDSGDEADSEMGRRVEVEETNRPTTDESEDELQTSAATQLVADADTNARLEDEQAVVMVDVVDDDLDDEVDDVVHRGGELLDDAALMIGLGAGSSLNDSQFLNTLDSEDEPSH